MSNRVMERDKMYRVKGKVVYNQGKYNYAIPADYADGCTIGDCWLVDINCHVHPGYNVSPIPLHVGQLGKEIVKEDIWPR